MEREDDCVHNVCSRVDAVRPHDRSWSCAWDAVELGLGTPITAHSAAVKQWTRLDLAESRVVSAAKHHGDDGEK